MKDNCSLHPDNFTSLSKHPLGSLREVMSLSLPIIVTFLSGNLMGFCDRLFLAHDSLESLEGCVNGSFLCYVFQIAAIFCARATQVFVGQCSGNGQYRKIGVYIWQMIWLSLFSMVFIIPLERLVEYFFFKDTAVKEAGMTYSHCLMWFNFLYPIGTALSSFYIGRGKLKFILLVTILSNLFNLALDPLFIFGYPGIFPRLGIFGAALATGLSQGVLCFILFLGFLSPKNQALYGTHTYQINWQALWESFKLGFPKSISKSVVTTIGILNVHVMTIMGGDYLLALSIGSSVGLLFLFLNEGMWQGVLTVSSYAIGKSDYEAVMRVIKTGLFSLFLFASFVALPCLIFPHWMISTFFSHVVQIEQIDILVKTCRWFWLFFICHGLTGIPFFCLVAKKDTLFTMFYNIFFTWIFQYIPLLITMTQWHWTADRFYLVLAVGNFISALVYFVRFIGLRARQEISSQSQTT